MENLRVDGDADVKDARSRRGWMLMAIGLGAAAMLSACGKKNNNDDDDEEPPPAP
jgi:hypothetical protein